MIRLEIAYIINSTNIIQKVLGHKVNLQAIPAEHTVVGRRDMSSRSHETLCCLLVKLYLRATVETF